MRNALEILELLVVTNINRHRRLNEINTGRLKSLCDSLWALRVRRLSALLVTPNDEGEENWSDVALVQVHADFLEVSVLEASY